MACLLEMRQAVGYVFWASSLISVLNVYTPYLILSHCICCMLITKKCFWTMFNACVLENFVISVRYFFPPLFFFLFPCVLHMHVVLLNISINQSVCFCLWSKDYVILTVLELIVSTRLAWNSQGSDGLWFLTTGFKGVCHHAQTTKHSKILISQRWTSKYTCLNKQ